MGVRHTVANIDRASPEAALQESRRKDDIAIIGAMRWQDLPDEGLISRYRAESGTPGSQQYVDELFRRYHAKVAFWCLSFTGDRESAADLAQDICAKAYTHLFSFKAQSKFSTWLYSIARNHCLNAVRTRASAPRMESEDAVINCLPDFASKGPHAAVEHEELVETARELVNNELEETERLVFTLHFSEEMPLDVITRMLSLENPSGAKAFLVSAKRKLERAVQRHWQARPKATTSKTQE
jgi:RNA polymerase sigma-70 factor (ECF subfamily)